MRTETGIESGTGNETGSGLFLACLASSVAAAAAAVVGEAAVAAGDGA